MILPDLAATERLARALAGVARRGDVIGLSGGLGLGKTSFARAFIRARPGGDAVAEVPSPTFTLVQVYELGEAPVWHFDLYRLKRPEELWELGFEEALAEGIALIEWPERAADLLPSDRLQLTFAGGDASESRRLRLTAGDGEPKGWRQRLARAIDDYERADA